MPLIPDIAVFQRKLATLPLATYQAGETVLSAASTTGRLLILKEGAVAVVKEGVEIAKVTEPGAVFGELSVLLDQPHTADVRALEASQFHVADAASILRVDPIALLYVATVLAQRLDSANRGLLELKRQVQGGEPRSVISGCPRQRRIRFGCGGKKSKVLLRGSQRQHRGDDLKSNFQVSWNCPAPTGNPNPFDWHAVLPDATRRCAESKRMAWACRGFQDVTMKGHPYSETSRNQSGGNGKQSGRAHLSSPIQSARLQQAVWWEEVCRTMASAAVMGITKWSISGSEKKTTAPGYDSSSLQSPLPNSIYLHMLQRTFAGRVHRAVPPNH
jgi:CRP/FNR family cyclic AMP-dependent transcriptional regulator